MKNVKKLFALLGLIAAFGLAQAQGSAKADKILKVSQEKFNSLKDISASFTYSLSNPNLKKPIVKTGKVIFKKNKYRITFPSEEMYCNGTYIWVKLNEDEEVNKVDYTDESISPGKIFQVYEDEMKSRYDGEANGQTHITLFANDKKADIWKTEIWINKSDKMISKATMHARNGSIYEYVLANIKTNISVTDSMFELDEVALENDGWIVNDLTD